jgi:hypothetical protein
MTVAPDEFLDAQEEAARNRKILLYGEFEFRHYPSPRELKRSGQERDVKIPIDGPTGHHLFAMSERTGLAFQIHYEIEDALLAPLEAMLTRYPKAKVIWCHLAQIRYIERLAEYDRNHRAFLQQLPVETRHQVAYRSAWRLLFDEEFIY